MTEEQLLVHALDSAAGDDNHHVYEIALNLRLLPEQTAAVRRQSAAAEAMQAASQAQGAVADDMLRIAREQAGFAKQALEDNKKMVALHVLGGGEHGRGCVDYVDCCAGPLS